MSSPLSALRRQRPLSFPGPGKPAMAMAFANPTEVVSVRWASIVPYVITNPSPPQPPMTPEQVQNIKQAREQVQLEADQLARLQQELSRHLAQQRSSLQGQQSLLRKWSVQRPVRGHRGRSKEESQLRVSRDVGKSSSEENQDKETEHGQDVAAAEHKPKKLDSSGYSRPRSMFMCRGSDQRMALHTETTIDPLAVHATYPRLNAMDDDGDIVRCNDSATTIHGQPRPAKDAP